MPQMISYALKWQSPSTSSGIFNNITQFFRTRRRYLYKMYTMNRTYIETPTQLSIHASSEYFIYTR